MSESKTPISDNADLYDYQTAIDTCRKLETELAKAQSDLGEALDYIADCYDPDKKAVLFEQGKDILIKRGWIK